MRGGGYLRSEVDWSSVLPDTKECWMVGLALVVRQDYQKSIELEYSTVKYRGEMESEPE